ncbi:hypothetical protein CAI21_08855 [Alkalilimnicola ehrlichii]|uniref:Uncharacterized protein n=1 Tax=Alkalilimnicola ehrlichii TaxID=351052 RepID=A0A3E0WWG0_9GAMM|nr:hypothetical protein [Alkalilimnicola ehrlichii]RFA29925.1 hypothetical protein CAI21_08855 [Alkalilimnicola ehrlichii]RFA36513.1 hypothetical protein CAL65_11130 [Alkalilimnicola ehrlichii]
MNIEDPNELLALHRCLLEAKFSPDPDDRDIAGSPIVAKLANNVVAELEAREGAQWGEWRRAENHPQKVSALVSALSQRSLQDLPQSERAAFIHDALAPLVASEELIDEVVEKVFGLGKV